MKSMRRARAVTSTFHRLTHELAAAAKEGRTGAVAQLEREVQALGGCASLRAATQRCAQRARLRVCACRLASTTQSRSLSGGVGADDEPPPDGQVRLRSADAPWVTPGARRAAAAAARGWCCQHAATVCSLAGRACHRPALHTPAHRATRLLHLVARGRVRRRGVQHGASGAAYARRGSHVAADAHCLRRVQVLNCVPDALSRGAMLRGMRAHLRDGGLLFVMLPLRCLTHSPHTTHARFGDALALAGFTVRARHASSQARWSTELWQPRLRAGAGHQAVAQGGVHLRARHGAASRSGARLCARRFQRPSCGGCARR